MIYRGSHETGEIEIVKQDIVFRNKFAKIYNDKVIFPNGSNGKYLRLLWKIPVGAVILPIMPGNKIVLLRTFRHAIRAWSLEIPRGFGDQGESPAETAARELNEETGLTISKLFELGAVTPDSGILGARVPLFIARIAEKEEKHLHKVKNEAIKGIAVLEYSKVLEMITNGQIWDGYTIASIFKAILLKYLPFG